MRQTLHLKHDAFTLYEVLIVVLLVSIFVVVATPSFHKIIMRHYTRQFTHELEAMLAYGKSEALLTGQDVCLCPSDNGKSCSQAWKHYLILKDGCDIGSQMIRVMKVQPQHASLSWHGFYANTQLNFKPVLMNETLNGRFYYQADPGSPGISIILNRFGRVRVEND